MKLGKGWEQHKGFNQGVQGHRGLYINASSVRKHTGENCKFLQAMHLECVLTKAQPHCPGQGAALCVSAGSLSPFQTRPAVWGRLCQALAAAQEELHGCARSQAVPLALVATALPTPCHAKFPALVTAARHHWALQQGTLLQNTLKMPRDNACNATSRENLKRLEKIKSPSSPNCGTLTGSAGQCKNMTRMGLANEGPIRQPC